jgi:ribosomal protein S25
MSEKKDELYNQVKIELAGKKTISAKFLKQKHNIRLSEAAEILDRLKEDGLIS